MKAVLLVIAMLLLPVTAGVVIEPAEAAGTPLLVPPGNPVLNGRSAGMGQHGSNGGFAGSGSGVAQGGYRWGPPQDRGPSADPGRHGPERSMASRAVDEIRRDPSDTDLNALVRRWRFRAFRRIFGKNALEHEKRRIVYELIRSDPGIDIQAISSQTGININTLRYHLGRLQSFGNVVTFEEGGVVRYYENHG
ncbi:MAG: winged helix-turn-helix transcriptional regulator, partial [Methanoregulaceae archaeon]|nr:winged helix-turn-helix transcriptional regulator [Methanoregulaceae archaeon]